MTYTVKLLSTFLLATTVQWCAAQDSIYVRKLADSLASSAFAGRGYVDSGLQKAGAFIAKEMADIGLKPVPKLNGYKQPLSYSVNTFPGKTLIRMNKLTLVPGKDYLISAESKGGTYRGRAVQVDSTTWLDRERMVAIQTVNKLTWSVARKQNEFTMINVTGFELPKTFAYDCVVETEMVEDFKTENILGMVTGTTHPDSVLIVCAHYDHLGKMGTDAVFNGANDNASGVALMLGLARKIVAKPLPYSVLFIAFTGEEAGLLGSDYYVKNPAVPLKQTKFVMNLDLMANGEEGITVVNATEYPKEFDILKDINKQQNLFKHIGSRGKAANSDHYHFSENGVPSFFIYTLGARKAYHDIEDVKETLPWYEVNDLMSLLEGFLLQMSK